MHSTRTTPDESDQAIIANNTVDDDSINQDIWYMFGFNMFGNILRGGIERQSNPEDYLFALILVLIIGTGGSLCFFYFFLSTVREEMQVLGVSRRRQVLQYLAYATAWALGPLFLYVPYLCKNIGIRPTKNHQTVKSSKILVYLTLAIAFALSLIIGISVYAVQG